MFIVSFACVCVCVCVCFLIFSISFSSHLLHISWIAPVNGSIAPLIKVTLFHLSDTAVENEITFKELRYVRQKGERIFSGAINRLLQQ